MNITNFGNTLKSLLAAWVTLIFGTSLLIFLFEPIKHPVYHTNVFANALISIWEIGDAMGPLVKLSLIGLFTTLVLGFQKFQPRKKLQLYSMYILFALIATVFVLAFLPPDYSRGYGIGLTGERFDKQILHLYLIGAVAAGAVFAFTLMRLENAERK